MTSLIPAPGAFSLGVILLISVIWEAFESVILPRRVTRKFRFARVFYRYSWMIWQFIIGLVPSRKSREALLGFYGPSSLLVLVALWAVTLVLGFGLMQYGAGSAVVMTGGQPSFLTDLYLSGTTFFTLGLGDVLPRSGFARALVVAEAGLGFGFLAAMIGYLPFIYGSFSKREVNISLLDSRAGTPPTAGELLRRHSYPQGQTDLRILLKDWELWSAELMESHLSYPVLAFFRSQHDNQSWVASLTAILDTCALLKTRVDVDGSYEHQADLTFAIARHAVVDLSQVFGTSPKALPHDRLTPENLRRIRDMLAPTCLKLQDGEQADGRLTELRKMYEPYIYALASYLHQTLPPWIPQKKGKDNWQTTAWGKASGLLDEGVASVVVDEHF
ncbi:MAG TPA: potassium channel family protein [Candidatus Dormibacteraeota bacterium]|nr:potassium channel family protein [Candidatus Dormibacteraeota bacterium]